MDGQDNPPSLEFTLKARLLDISAGNCDAAAALSRSFKQLVCFPIRLGIGSERGRLRTQIFLPESKARIRDQPRLLPHLFRCGDLGVTADEFGAMRERISDSLTH